MASQQSVPRRPLHLLIVSNTESAKYIQGADRDWVNLLNALGPAQVRVTCAGVANTRLLRKHLDERLTTRFIDLHFTPFYGLFHKYMYRRLFTLGWAGLSTWGLRRLSLLRRRIGQDKPDLVVTNTSVVWLGAAHAFLARLPHVWCVKEFLDPAVAGSRRYARLIERLSDLVIVPSEATAKVFNRRVRVLHDGNDLSVIRRSAGRVSRRQVLESLGLPPEQLVIAQIGVVSWAKGQHVTAKACAQLASEGSSPCSILFLGLVAPRAKEKLRGILAGSPNGWQSSLRFVEFCSDDLSYLSAADIVVHPSVLPDPYPNAVREALILGKPVIGSRAGGILELIVDGLSGVLIEPDDPSELAAALKRLINSPEERVRLGAEARKFADSDLDINVRKDAFMEAFLSVLKH